MSVVDGVIAGTGNSRYLKSVSNFLSLYPTYSNFVSALVEGTLPIDLNGLNAAGWTTLATALSKANLLDDTTAAAIATFTGQSTPSTVNAALAAFAAATRVKVETTSYTGTGTGGSSNPSSIAFTGTPHIVFIRGGSEGALGIFLPQSLTTSYANYSYAYIANTVARTVGHFAQKSSDGKTLYWYNTYNAESVAEQFNENGVSYAVVAVTL